MLAELDAVSQSLGRDFPLLGRMGENSLHRGGGVCKQWWEEKGFETFQHALSASSLYQVCMCVRA